MVGGLDSSTRSSREATLPPTITRLDHLGVRQVVRRTDMAVMLRRHPVDIILLKDSLPMVFSQGMYKIMGVTTSMIAITTTATELVNCTCLLLYYPSKFYTF